MYDSLGVAWVGNWGLCNTKGPFIMRRGKVKSEFDLSSSVGERKRVAPGSGSYFKASNEADERKW